MQNILGIMCTISQFVSKPLDRKISKYLYDILSMSSINSEQLRWPSHFVEKSVDFDCPQL